MFVRIVHHWCRPGRVQAGRDHIDQVGLTTAAATGFLYRYRLETPDDPSKLTTMTVWRDRDSFAGFQAGRKPSDHSDPANPFERLESETFDVKATVGEAGAKI